MQDRLDRVLAELGDPRVGLPDPVFDFVRQVTPLINVDLLVQSERLGTLLAWRKDPYDRGWHIPGGIIRFREPSTHRIAEVARAEIGCPVTCEHAPCHVVEFLNHERGHFISLLYRCRLEDEADVVERSIQNVEPRHGELCWFASAPTDLYSAHEVYSSFIGRGSISHSLSSPFVNRPRSI